MGERRTVSLEDLGNALKPLIRRGLPITETNAGAVLPNLRCIYARAVHPSSRASRLTALDTILRSILDGIGDNPDGTALRILFAVHPPLLGSTLTRRRHLAAEAIDRNPDHFRQHIEPRLRQTVAEELQRLNLLYTPRRQGTRPPQALSGASPGLHDHDYTEQEELISRIWSAVYGYRAELIATQRTAEEPATSQEHAQTGLWQLARLLTALNDYLDRYGDTLLHGELEYAAESVIHLAGWKGNLTDQQAQQLRYTLARTCQNERSLFLKLLYGHD